MDHRPVRPTRDATRVVAVAALASSLASVPAQAQAGSEAAAAFAVLEKHCFSCHGRDGSFEGDLRDVRDREGLVAGGFVKPGATGESPLLARVLSEEMPPEKVVLRLTNAEKSALGAWVRAGAPALPPPTAAVRARVGQGVWDLIAADLKAAHPRTRPYLRYLSLMHLLDANVDAAGVKATRDAVTKHLNGLTWSRLPVQLVPVDPAGGLLRLDLRDAGWTVETWDELVARSPYSLYPFLRSLTDVVGYVGQHLPLVRADWFVAATIGPGLYHRLLDLPGTAAELEKRLRVEVDRDIATDRVVRAGFVNSGVSRHNRVIERHASAFGSYWKSYDFGGSTGARNILEHPIGPGTQSDDFHADGGEVIFTLPNGLHAYMLVDGNGRRIDRGPTTIVKDPNSDEGAVENPLSCLNCHAGGFIEKDDQVRGAVVENPAFPAPIRERIDATHPPSPAFASVIAQDNRDYRAALTAIGLEARSPDPIVAAKRRFDAPLTLEAAAGEAGLSPRGLREAISRSTALSKSLAPLLAPKGLIGRSVFEQAFRIVVQQAALGLLLQPNRTGGADLVRPMGELRDDPLSGLRFVNVEVTEAPLGCVAGDALCDGDEAARKVVVSGFWIAQHETSVAAFRRCVDAGGCSARPLSRTVGGRAGCSAGLGDGSLPMNCVNRDEAAAFCAWAAGRLPTSDEWEAAGRASRSQGAKPTRYAFGDTISSFRPATNGRDRDYLALLASDGAGSSEPPTPRLRNLALRSSEVPEPEADVFARLSDGFPLLAPVDAGPEDLSPLQLRHLSGNVREWTSSPFPGRPGSVETRGGSFDDGVREHRLSFRNFETPDRLGEDLGFRCVQPLALTVE